MIGQFFLEKRFARGVGELGRIKKTSPSDVEVAARTGAPVTERKPGDKR
jgi:hypothetical protein